MLGVKRYMFFGLSFLLPISTVANVALCGELSMSTEVQKNINTLQMTKSCPQCDLSGADLNRMDLSGANLEGANLSRAKLNLANLSGANLRKADLRDVVFGGADLADADLRSADLRGTSFAGAYMQGALLDGELISTTPYAQEQVSNVEEMRYVEDTVKPKIVPKTEEMSIGERRDFEEIPPTLPVEQTKLDTTGVVDVVKKETVEEELASDNEAAFQAIVPQESAAAPESKIVPSIEQVRIADLGKEPVDATDGKDAVQQAEIVRKEKISQEDQEALTDTLFQTQGTIQNEKSTVEVGSSPQVAEVTDKSNVIESEVTPDQESVSMENEMPGSQAGQELEKAGQGVAIDSTDMKLISEEKSSSPTNGIEASTTIVEQDIAEKEVSQEDINVEIEQNVPTMDSEVQKNVEILLDTNQCYGCNLEGADLSGKDLDEADLEGANLKNANLTGADFNKANLKGTNLSGANLRKSDLDEADLYKADLTDADLTDASLEETLIDDAVLTRVKGYKPESLLMME